MSNWDWKQKTINILTINYISIKPHVYCLIFNQQQIHAFVERTHYIFWAEFQLYEGKSLKIKIKKKK